MIYERLRYARELRELKEKDVAEMLNISPSTVSGWETGKDPISIKRIIMLANIYEITLDYIFGLEDISTTFYKIESNLDIMSDNLRKIRIENNYTQEQIARFLNTSQAGYAHYENSRNIIPTSFIQELINLYPDFSVDKLFRK